jgi:two-component system response regulator HydG
MIERVGGHKQIPVDIRVISATNQDLQQLITQNSFRQDLYYRIKVLTLEVPPLRERRDDVMPLALRFLGEERTAARGFSAQAKSRLLAYDWPGNVRELQNVVKHGAALASAAEVRVEDLPEDLTRAQTPPPRGLLLSLAEVEREHILRVLDACGGSQAEAARVLGIGRNTLWRKLRELAA